MEVAYLILAPTARSFEPSTQSRTKSLGFIASIKNFVLIESNECERAMSRIRCSASCAHNDSRSPFKRLRTVVGRTPPHTLRISRLILVFPLPNYPLLLIVFTSVGHLLMADTTNPQVTEEQDQNKAVSTEITTHGSDG